MAFKKIVKTFIALCITAVLVTAACGCDDLGEYADTDEYYSSFGDIVLISGTSRSKDSYSVEEYFYNESSRENFLMDGDGAYEGVEHSDYVYMAIPFENDINMDTLALFMQSQDDVIVYMNIYVTDVIPSEWKSIEDTKAENEGTVDETESEESVDETENSESADESGNDEWADEIEKEKVYDDPDPQTRIGEIKVQLKDGNWNSFVLDDFNVDGNIQKSIQIKDGQYILIQIRNNSGVRIFDRENKIYLDPQTGIELQRAEITMTNLLIRALGSQNDSEVQGGE